ncbi:hypothetical protein BH11BAC4_BH11BAC4_18440 [soil metagenome]
MGAFEFIKQQNQAEALLLAGAFLHAVNFEEFLPGVFATYSGPVVQFMEEEKELLKKQVQHFEDLCHRNGIEYRVHDESMNWNIEDLEKETRFTDMMVMSEELFCNEFNQREPNSFMQQTIHRSECPVVCVPEKFRPFNKIVFAYDGGKDSMFALKQFCNLFPGFAENETNIVYARQGDNDIIPDLAYLEEYAGRHFKNLNFEKLPFNGKKHFGSWVKDKDDILLVSGSYGRSGLSTSISKSFIDDIIHEHHIPVFIAHN